MKSKNLMFLLLIMFLSLLIIFISGRPTIDKVVDNQNIPNSVQTTSLSSANTGIDTDNLLRKFEDIKNFYCEYEIKHETGAISGMDSVPLPGIYRLWYKDGKVKTNYKVQQENSFYVYNPDNNMAYLYNVNENSAAKFSLDPEINAAVPIKPQELNPLEQMKQRMPRFVNNGTSVINNFPCDVFNYEDENIKVTYYYLQQTGFPITIEVRMGTFGHLFKYSIIFKDFKTGSVSNSDVSVPASARVGLLSYIP